MRRVGLFLVVAILAMGVGRLSAAGPIHVTVNVQAKGARISPQMWGIFFEDINFGADGGLYAELVKNRGFEFPEPLMGWTKISPSMARGTLMILTNDPAEPANPHYLRISSEGGAVFGVANEGFRGMGFRSNETYVLSLYVRRVSGDPALVLELVADDGTVLASARLRELQSTWSKKTLALVPTETEPKGKLNLLLEGRGAVDVDFVSLFPQKTWKGRPGGLRADLVQLLAELKPGFLRFPGGCIVEGSHLDRRYQWKKTVGPVEKRPLLVNRWNYEFKHRPTPDYYQSFGLGFFEYFQLAEDLGAEPLPIINCGMACQFNSGELCPTNELGPFIQDALDLIEFANGAVTSRWGALRAELGHPAPFNLKMLGIGNEQWGPQYIERYELFARAIKNKHPEIRLVAAAGPSPADERFLFLWDRLRELGTDIIDEHCYARPIWFLTQFHRYDAYPRRGPKVFMGEYAAQTVAIASPRNRNTLECALAEAAYMLGMERNADVVCMASYAPLFAHAEAWQWTPDLIWFDNLRAVPTPNYYVQKLFSHHRGDVLLAMETDASARPVPRRGRIGLGTFSTAVEFKDIEVRSGQTVLYSSASGRPPAPTKEPWSFVDGALAQTNPKGTHQFWFGETNWAECTISFKVRKIRGDEGFAVYLVADPATDSHLLWNVGGWKNTRHGLIDRFAEQDHFLGAVEGSVLENKWYDVRVVMAGDKIECFLDGAPVQTAVLPARRVYNLYASATMDEKASEAIIKLVNPHGTAQPVTVRLAGARKVRSEAKVVTLTGPGPNAMNTFEAPGVVAPVESVLRLDSGTFAYEVPPHALVIFRVAVE